MHGLLATLYVPPPYRMVLTSRQERIVHRTHGQRGDVFSMPLKDTKISIVIEREIADVMGTKTRGHEHTLFMMREFDLAYA